MAEPICTQKAPYIVDVEAGTYWWCACGKSTNQPFCDGSHTDTDITPIKVIAESNTTLRLCGCRWTKKPPLCDGAHNDG